MSMTVFRSARIVDPSRGLDEIGSIIVDGGSMATLFRDSGI